MFVSLSVCVCVRERETETETETERQRDKREKSPGNNYNNFLKSSLNVTRFIIVRKSFVILQGSMETPTLKVKEENP